MKTMYGFDDSYQPGRWIDECDDLPITRQGLEDLGIDMSPLDEYDPMPACDTNAPACSAPAWPYVVVVAAMAAVWLGWRLAR